MSSISIGHQAMTIPPLLESSGNRLIQFLPKEWQNGIKCIISSPCQENKELTISSLVASLIKTLDKNSKDIESTKISINYVE